MLIFYGSSFQISSIITCLRLLGGWHIAGSYPLSYKLLYGELAALAIEGSNILNLPLVILHFLAEPMPSIQLPDDVF